MFAIGPLTSGLDDLAAARGQLDHALDKIAELQPVTVAVFGGVVDPTQLRFPFSHMAASDAPTGIRSAAGRARWPRCSALASGAAPRS